MTNKTSPECIIAKSGLPKFDHFARSIARTVGWLKQPNQAYCKLAQGERAMLFNLVYYANYQEECDVDANLFAYNALIMRINSHLQ